MPLFKRHIDEQYQWGIWKVEEGLEQFLSLLPQDSRKEYILELQKFTSESRRIERLAVRVLLFKLLGEVKKIEYEPSGRPYFSDGSAFLSISHTHGYVAVIVSKQHEVGIDIEQMRNRVLKVASKFVREDEKTQIIPERELVSLLLIWSAKEVMFKCMNENEVDFREHLFVDLSKADTEYYMDCREFRSSLKRHFRIYYMVHSDFVMTWSI